MDEKTDRRPLPMVNYHHIQSNGCTFIVPDFLGTMIEITHMM